MKAGFRQKMTPLHTWGGLVFGWVLMAIFVAGTLSCFAGAITHWMEARTTGSVAVKDGPVARQQAVSAAARFLIAGAGDAAYWRIALPGSYSTDLRVWTEEDWWEHAPRRLDPRSGAERAGSPAADTATSVTVRETSGGSNFVRFHYDLHGGFAGLYLVGLTTVAMLIALVTGVIVHKRIFTDFFTLRFRKGQRSWLDAHNVASVLTLPFQLMIAYTGLVLFHFAWMPAPIALHYGLPGGLQGQFDGVGPYYEARRDDWPSIATPAAETVPLSALPAIVAQVEQASRRPVAWIDRTVSAEGVRLRIGIEPDLMTSIPSRWAPAYLVADATGTLVEEPGFTAAGLADSTMDVMSALHQLGFGGDVARWLWFVSGLVGCAMIATGLVLFTEKRRKRGLNEFGTHTARVYRLIDALNTASVAGMPVASIAYFWANRLIPAAQPGRAALEIDCFLLAWAVTAVHALFRGRRAWPEQFLAAAVLCLALPILNLATTGDWIVTYAARGDGQGIGVEAVAILFGLVFAATGARLARRAVR